MLEKINELYYWFWHDLMKRNEPYTWTIRRWVKAHKKLTIGASIGGFLTWWLLMAHILELW